MMRGKVGSALRSAARPEFAYPLLGLGAVGYSVVALELSLARALPMPEPYLRIADASYFFWGTFFYAPTIIAAWPLASCVIYLVCQTFGSKPAFDQLLTTVACATGIGTLGTLIPDLVTSSLRALGVIDEASWEASIAAARGGWFVFTWVTLVVYVALFAAGYPLAVRRASRLSWGRSIVVAWIGFVAFQGFEYVFIR